MAPSRAAPSGEPDEPVPPGEEMVDLLESIRDPACIYLPGGRIVAVNRAVERLADRPAVGMTIEELIEHYHARAGDRKPLAHGELPSTRALRGEILTHGERIDATLPDGSVYRAVVTSMPIIVDGRVVAALSVWHDFNSYLQGLADGPIRGDTDATAGRR